MANEPGRTAADFTLPDQDGNAVALRALLAKGPAVVFFYPKNGTPGCTKEACAFRDAYETFLQAGCSVVGISADAAASHGAFRQKHRLAFPLLTDADGAVARAWGVKKHLFGLMPGRATFVVDRTGRVRHEFFSLRNAERHVDEALKVVAGL